VPPVTAPRAIAATAIIAAVLGVGCAVLTTSPATAASTSTRDADVTADVPRFVGPFPIAMVGVPYFAEIPAVYAGGEIVGISPQPDSEWGTLPDGLRMTVVRGDTLRIEGTPTTAGHNGRAVVILEGIPTGGGDTVTHRSVLSLEVSSPIEFGAIEGAAPQLGKPSEVRLPLSYAGGTIEKVSAEGLPAGLTIDDSGLITGTPDVVGTFDVTFTATGRPDFSGPVPGRTVARTHTAKVSVEWNDFGLAADEMAHATVGEDYSWQLPLSDPSRVRIDGVSATNLPAGLVVSPTGLVSGNPWGTGWAPSGSVVEFTVTASPIGSVGESLVRTFRLPVNVGSFRFSIPEQDSPLATVGDAYEWRPRTEGAPAGTSVVSATATGLPDGLTITADGRVTGVPADDAGEYTARITLGLASQLTPSKISFHTAELPIEVEAWTFDLPADQHMGCFGWLDCAGQLEMDLTGATATKITATGLPHEWSVSNSGRFAGPMLPSGAYPVEVTVTSSSAHTPWIKVTKTTSMTIWTYDV
jgi:hypothetical protein